MAKEHKQMWLIWFMIIAHANIYYTMDVTYAQTSPYLIGFDHLLHSFGGAELAHIHISSFSYYTAGI